MQQVLARWQRDVYEMFAGIIRSPFSGKRWTEDFTNDEISRHEIQYAVLIGVVTLLPAGLVAAISSEPQWKIMAQFFGAPLQTVINGFLTSSLLFLGSYMNRKPVSYNYSFRLMLRVMSIYPLFRLFAIHPFLFAFSTLLFGFFVVRAAVKALDIPLRNALTFFGVIYFIFFLLQLGGGGPVH